MADEKERLPHNRHYVVENYEWFFERKDFMKKEFLHIFSFVMIAIFTFFCIGAVSAEETFDIPVIEEVSEEELAEVFQEEEDVEMMGEETTDPSFRMLKEDGETVTYTWDKDKYDTELRAALAASEDGYTLELLKDLEHTSITGSSNNYINVDGKNVTISGNGHTLIYNATSSAGRLFTLLGTANLTLKNLVYDGNDVCPLVRFAGAGTVNIDNCVIYKGKTTNTNYSGAVFVTADNATININDTTIASCRGRNGGAINASWICTVNLENVDITGCSTMSGSNSGAVYVGAGSTLNLAGNTNITGNTNGTAEDNIYIATGNVVVGNDFSGEIGVNDAGVSSLTTEDGFAALDSVESITKDGSNSETFAYYDEANKKFAWTIAPVLTLTTDSGKYSDELGTIRFLTTFKSVYSDAVASYGTYAVGESSFNENAEWEKTEFREFDKTPGADKLYYVDVVKIPDTHFNTEIAALSFVKIKGIKTPIYYNFNLASVNKNDTETGDGTLKNLGDPAYTEA